MGKSIKQRWRVRGERSVSERTLETHTGGEMLTHSGGTAAAGNGREERKDNLYSTSIWKMNSGFYYPKYLVFPPFHHVIK